MKSKLKTLAKIAPLVLILDQLTKGLIVAYIPLGARRVVLENFFDIVHTRNKGAAFGFLSDWSHSLREPFFYLVSAIALIFLFYFLKQIPEKSKGGVAPVALILGGALGNIVDRFMRGSVVDFISLHWYNASVDWNVLGFPVNFPLIWPAFNVADSAISVGVVWLLVVMSRQGDKIKS